MPFLSNPQQTQPRTFPTHDATNPYVKLDAAGAQTPNDGLQHLQLLNR